MIQMLSDMLTHTGVLWRCRKRRRQIPGVRLKHAARRPCSRPLSFATSTDPVVVLDWRAYTTAEQCIEDLVVCQLAAVNTCMPRTSLRIVSQAKPASTVCSADWRCDMICTRKAERCQLNLPCGSKKNKVKFKKKTNMLRINGNCMNPWSQLTGLQFLQNFSSVMSL